MTANPVDRVLAEERLILDVSELIYEAMELRGVSKIELARRIKRTRAFVTQILSGERNMTLRTFAALCHALDINPVIGLRAASPKEH